MMVTSSAAGVSSSSSSSKRLLHVGLEDWPITTIIGVGVLLALFLFLPPLLDASSLSCRAARLASAL